MKKYIHVSGNNDVTHIRIDIDYDLGGYSYTTYRPKPRGYYLSVVPVKREERYGFMMESFTAFTGYRQLLREVTRKSAKAEKLAEQTAEELVPIMVRKICEEMHLTVEEEAA